MNTLIETYFNGLRGKRCLVLGLGVSNRPLVRMLLEYGCQVTACDRAVREQLSPEVLEFERRGAVLHLGEHYLDNLSGDIVFRTPGLHPDIPQLAALRAQGARITSEMEVFFQICPCKVIGVTGSDGKTTTTTLIAEFLKAAGKTVWVGGNIGAPLLPLVDQMSPEDLAVVELSSFQLLGMKNSCHIAVITNLAPNHLDMHKSLEEYYQAKENIYLYQDSTDTLVVNMDNAITHQLPAKARGQVLEFSRLGIPDQGVYFKDGVIYRKGKTTRPILNQTDIRLPGIHNVENYMAAIAAVGDLVPDRIIREVARTFGGVEHRIELVRIKDGVSFYNDSIASSPNRTIAGLHSFDQKLILIAGGKDKGIPYDVLGPEICQKVKTLVLTGATAGVIGQATRNAPHYQPGAPEIIEIDDFAEAIRTAAQVAQPGDVVLLSPASTAFDKFPNFMVRGTTFKKIVMEL